MGRLHSALVAAMQPSPRQVGDVLDTAVIRAQVHLIPTDYEREEGTALHLRLLHVPYRPGTEETTEQVERWIVTFGSGFDEVADILASRSDFEALTETVRANTRTYTARSSGGADWSGSVHWAVAEQMLRDFLINSYDATDPAEAAEQVLVALGAEPRFLPATLTKQ